MKSTNLRAIFALVVGLCVSAGVVAQTRGSNNRPAFPASANTAVSDKYVISAKAGGVNYVEGAVSIIRAQGKSGLLLRSDRVEIGDRVTTGDNGRVEILLNPGSFIRLAKNSSFEFGSTDLEDLHLTLDSGSAIFEVFAADEFRVSVFTPKGKLSLIETGVYRVDISNDGTALLSVTKGKAEVLNGTTATTIKDGRTGTVGTDSVAVAKFDKGKRDEFAEWSRTRSNDLTKIASSLRPRDINNTILSGFRNGRWDVYSSFGLWVYNAQYGYCFLPYGFGWRSPYGGWYHNGINPYFIPYYPTGGVVGGGGGGTPPTRRKVLTPIQTGGSGTSGRLDTLNPRVKGSTSNSTGNSYEPPPFTVMTRGGKASNGGFNGGSANTNSSFDNFGGGRSGGSAGPSYSPPVSAPAPAVISPTTGGKGNN